MSVSRRRHANRSSPLVVTLVTLGLLASGCGGTKSGQAGKPSKGNVVSLRLTDKDGESGLADAGNPKRGGTVVYGLESETEGGFCLPDAQLAISGMMVARALYDTLTVPDADGRYAPSLAKSIDHGADYKTWTITLRSGIKFHDGSALDATVVKNNLDAYRGVDPHRPSQLFGFVLANIATVTATGPLTVQVTTKTPWVAFPAYLYSSGRLGMMAQAQLDADDCSTHPIGTGPFSFVSWTQNQKLVVKRNPRYWQIAPDGKPYPYLDGIEFRPIPDSMVRNQAIESGAVDIMHTSIAGEIKNKIRKLRDAGKVNLFVSEQRAEVEFLLLNNTKAPFDDVRMRRALAMALDRTDINLRINDGLSTVPDGPFAPGSVGYLKDPGFPRYDLAGAKKLVAAYKAEGHDPSFSIINTNDAISVKIMELIQARATAAGFGVRLLRQTQSVQITSAIARDYQASVFRNYPGEDPDSNYVWWYGTTTGADGVKSSNLVNFSGFDDAELNALLDQGRGEPDPAKRKTIYENINKRMADQVFNVWLWDKPWAIVENRHLHDVLGPKLPDGALPSRGLATGHSLLGLWLDT